MSNQPSPLKRLNHTPYVWRIKKNRLSIYQQYNIKNVSLVVAAYAGVHVIMFTILFFISIYAIHAIYTKDQSLPWSIQQYTLTGSALAVAGLVLAVFATSLHLHRKGNPLLIRKKSFPAGSKFIAHLRCHPVTISTGVGGTMPGGSHTRLEIKDESGRVRLSLRNIWDTPNLIELNNALATLSPGASQSDQE